MALIILAGLQSIDRSLYEVADVAGASRIERFRTVTLPLVMPSVLVAMLFRTIGSMRVYGLIDTVSSCSTVPSLSCLVVQSFSASRYASAATVAFVTAALIGLVVSVYIIKFADVQGGGGV
jgi:multiple sugar transport system permease protein